MAVQDHLQNGRAKTISLRLAVYETFTGNLGLIQDAGQPHLYLNPVARHGQGASRDGLARGHINFCYPNATDVLGTAASKAFDCVDVGHQPAYATPWLFLECFDGFHRVQNGRGLRLVECSDGPR